MNHSNANVVPVWTLTTNEAAGPLPAVTGEAALTPERLSKLRGALAAFSTAPLVTLEAYPLEKRRGGSSGLSLDAVSPLAQELSRLVTAHAQRVPAVAQVVESPEVLYRMVVPAKVAAQFGKGLVKPMKSNAVHGGIHSALRDAKSVVTHATFVPVKAAPTAAAGGAAAGTVAAGGALTVAAPLILLAVAVGASAHAEHQRQRAIERITDLLEQLHDDNLNRERNELDGCRDAIDKATALLLDRGKVGASLGLDSAVHAISTAIQSADRRARKWEAALDALGNRVEVPDLETAFPGLSEAGGAFRAHLELASLAIALKRRVVLLQGVEAGQSDPDNQFENFVRSLNADQQRILDLEARIEGVLVRLSRLEVRSPSRWHSQLIPRKQVESLLETTYRLRELGDGVVATTSNHEVVIEMEKHCDGTLLVLPAHAA